MVKKQPNYKLHVLYALVSAFLITFTLRIKQGPISVSNTTQTEGTVRNTFRADAVGEAMKGWVVIAVVLFSLSAFDSTAPLAAAFAWLILVTVVLANTDRLFELFSTAPTGVGGGGGARKP